LRALAHFSEFTSFDSEIYSRERTEYYLVLGFVPRVRFDLNSKVYFALHFPFDFFGVGVDFVNTYNPLFPESRQKQGGGNFVLGGEALIRFGVGYKF